MSEAICVGNLRTINTAQVTYWGGDSTKGFARTLKELGPKGAGILDSELSSGKADGYIFRLVPKPPTEGRMIEHYSVTASPIIRLSKKQRSFYTDESGVIRFTTHNRTAKSSDPVVD